MCTISSTSRSSFTLLRRELDDLPKALVIFNHPKNIGFPTYRRARGYGLFAANPLSQEVISNGKEKLDLHAGTKTVSNVSLSPADPFPSNASDPIETQYRRFMTE